MELNSYSPDIQRSLGRLEGKIDLVISETRELKVNVDTLEKNRLSKIETEVANLTGRVVAISAVASAVFGGLVAFIVKQI